MRNKRKPTRPNLKPREFGFGFVVCDMKFSEVIDRCWQTYNRWREDKSFNQYDLPPLTKMELMRKTVFNDYYHRASSPQIKVNFSKEHKEAAMAAYERKMTEYYEWFEANKHLIEEEKTKKKRATLEKKRKTLLEKRDKIDKELNKIGMQKV